MNNGNSNDYILVNNDRDNGHIIHYKIIILSSGYIIEYYIMDILNTMDDGKNHFRHHSHEHPWELWENGDTYNEEKFPEVSDAFIDVSTFCIYFRYSDMNVIEEEEEEDENDVDELFCNLFYVLNV